MRYELIASVKNARGKPNLYFLCGKNKMLPLEREPQENYLFLTGWFI